jgi:hypothetical protein
LLLLFVGDVVAHVTASNRARHGMMDVVAGDTSGKSACQATLRFGGSRHG